MATLEGREKVPAIGSTWLYQEGTSSLAGHPPLRTVVLVVVRADSWTGEVILRPQGPTEDLTFERPSGVPGTGKLARPICLAIRVTDKMAKADKELKVGDLATNAAWTIWGLMCQMDPAGVSE